VTARISSAIVAIAVVLAASAASATDDAAAAPQPVKRKPVAIPHGHVVIAVAKAKRVRIYARAGAKRPVATLGRKTRHGAQRVFLVDWRGKRWTWPRVARVFVPLRPNGRRGWVRASDVRFLVNPYHVTVRLHDRRLVVWRKGRVVLRTRIAIGRALTPTPAGKYYLTELLRQPNPRGAYGPYAFGTSAYSDVLQSFGGGPGQVGIHGTNRPRLVGTEVSHGCIRVRNATIRRLAKMLPLGTPVSIVVDRFDGKAARELVAKQVRFGPRPAGSPASRRLAAFLRKEVPNGRFQQVPDGLRNVIGVVRGRNPKRVVVVGAHYDTYAKPGFVGANDGASGTAVVLQLAKTIKPRTLRPTIVFAFFDGEEAPPGTDFRQNGMRGSKVAAQAFKNAQAMILLDMVGERGVTIPRELGSNRKLWSRLRQAAARVGARRVFPPRTRGRILDDHVPFRDLGIPAIDVIDFDFACWHKACDRYRGVSALSLDRVGESVFELLRRL
jgi:lipoprotein-anchoring transpeptidase ErfK/SrfK